jgi:hypothetical protein
LIQSLNIAGVSTSNLAAAGEDPRCWPSGAPESLPHTEIQPSAHSKQQKQEELSCTDLTVCQRLTRNSYFPSVLQIRIGSLRIQIDQFRSIQFQDFDNQQLKKINN